MLAEIDIDDFGDKEPSDFFHITMIHLGDEIPIETLAKTVAPVLAATIGVKPFIVSTSHVATFPPHPEKNTVPIICLIDSPDLHDLRAKIAQALDSAGIEYSKKFPEYRPHVTLGYSPDPLVNADGFDIHLPAPVQWVAHEVVLWGGDKGSNRVVVTFPLSLGMDKAASVQPSDKGKIIAYRAAVRLAMNAGQPGWPRRADLEIGNPCPKCGTLTEYDNDLGAYKCPVCGWRGKKEEARTASKVLSRFREAQR